MVPRQFSLLKMRAVLNVAPRVGAERYGLKKEVVRVAVGFGHMPGSDDQFPRDDERNPKSTGSGHAQWVALLYAELRAMAQAALNDERRHHTLSATALVNEVYVKFSGPAGAGDSDAAADSNPARSVDRAAFFGAAAQAMRRILVDHARGRNRQKRGGGKGVLGSDAFGTIADPLGDAALDPIELDEALSRLALEHADAARVVELRFFAGLPEKTIAEVMNMNERTVRRHWTFAKAWLAREMNPDGGHPPAAARDSKQARR